MKIATWNVNSIRARLERFLTWLAKAQPDVVCLQELKATDAAFPVEEVQKAGYHAAAYGQKTYNGVATLSRIQPADIHRGFDDGVEDPQARLLAARVGDIGVISAYVPNGQVVGTEPYAYKLAWLRRLRAFRRSISIPNSRWSSAATSTWPAATRMSPDRLLGPIRCSFTPRARPPWSRS